MFGYIVVGGAIIQLFGALTYVRATLRGQTKPNRISWLMWTIAPFIGTAAALSKGVGLAILPVFMAGFGPLLVFLSSFVNKNAYWKLEKFDWACGISSALALILWAVTRDPVIAIIFAILSDALAGVPTIIKSWKFPETENATVFILSTLGNLLSFLIIKSWTFSNWGFQAYLIVINLVIVFSIYRKKIFKTADKI